MWLLLVEAHAWITISSFCELQFFQEILSLRLLQSSFILEINQSKLKQLPINFRDEPASKHASVKWNQAYYDSNDPFHCSKYISLD